MAYAYKNFSLVATTSQQTAYTCPAATTAQVTLLRVANIHATAGADCTVVMTDASAPTDCEIIKNLTVPIQSAIPLLDGTLILEAGDSIKIQATAASSIRLLGSVMERS